MLVPIALTLGIAGLVWTFGRVKPADRDPSPTIRATEPSGIRVGDEVYVDPETLMRPTENVRFYIVRLSEIDAARGLARGLLVGEGRGGRLTREATNLVRYLDPRMTLNATTPWFSLSDAQPATPTPLIQPNVPAILGIRVRDLPGLPPDAARRWGGPEGLGSVAIQVTRVTPQAVEGLVTSHHDGGIAIGPPAQLNPPVPIVLPIELVNRLEREREERARDLRS